MSKQAKYEVELEKVNQSLLDDAVRMMCDKLNIKMLDKSSFRIFGMQRIPVLGTCVRLPESLYPVDIYADNNRIIFNGDNMDSNRIKKYETKIKQFYEAVELRNEFGGTLDYNQKEEKIELMIQV